ncbi:hypothetical protein [Streptomyces sp. NPDC059466]|uniref:hypothetical protein n=1 Tax=unclassified Streptomyces TaxID=2593676 RepID=UPI0036D0127D
MDEKLQVSATVRRWPPWTAEVSGHAADFARRVDAAAGDAIAGVHQKRVETGRIRPDAHIIHLEVRTRCAR